MAAAHRPIKKGALVFTAMFTMEPLTVGGRGYAQILQVGESYRGRVLTDRQHPHELLSQLSAGWTGSLGGSGVSVLGAPVGEAALGPPAFMHRASSVENPVAPLSHHIFDSTHIVSSVVLGRVDRGRVSVEGTVFRGREPDEKRYGMEVGTPDSWSARLWIRPTTRWTLQASRGFLRQPEQLEPGDQRRASASASWFRPQAAGFTAITMAVGRNRRRYSTLHGLLLEATHRRATAAAYARVEHLQVETEALLFPEFVHVPHPGELADRVTAVTVGGIRDVAQRRGMAVGVGVDVTGYVLPPLLRVTHGERPWSFHVFLRLSRTGREKRMLDMTMASHDPQGEHIHP